MNALSIRNLRKTYNNGFEALKGIDLNVVEGDFSLFWAPMVLVNQQQLG